MCADFEDEFEEPSSSSHCSPLVDEAESGDGGERGGVVGAGGGPHGGDIRFRRRPAAASWSSMARAYPGGGRPGPAVQPILDHAGLVRESMESGVSDHLAVRLGYRRPGDPATTRPGRRRSGQARTRPPATARRSSMREFRPEDNPGPRARTVRVMRAASAAMTAGVSSTGRTCFSGAAAERRR